MPYIYKIVNNINGKIYIGKTTETIEKRWKEHVLDSKREKIKNRPLYAAFNKYGVENFSIEAIEEVTEVELLNEREKFWIEYFGSFKNGYNATTGGDGKVYIDYEAIWKLWQKNYSQIQIADLLKCSPATVNKVLLIHQVSKKERLLRGQLSQACGVIQLTLENKPINYFFSMQQAQDVTGIAKQHIGQVCNGKRKTAGGFKWEKI